MYCVKCGTKNDEDSMFCTKCGIGLQNTDIGITKKIVNKDIRRFGKIDIKNRNVQIIAILGIAIIISVAFIILSNNHRINIYGDVEEPTVVQDTDNTILIGEQGKNVPNQETVEVSISSIPPGADIYINNVSKGKTPKKINLLEGNYSLKADLIGYKTVLSNFNVTIKPGYDTNATIDVTLEPID